MLINFFLLKISPKTVLIPKVSPLESDKFLSPSECAIETSFSVIILGTIITSATVPLKPCVELSGLPKNTLPWLCIGSPGIVDCVSNFPSINKLTSVESSS